MQLTLGTWTSTAAILGSSFYHLDTAAGKHYCGILPLLSSLRTQPYASPMACRCQCWDASGQATNWVGRQPHPLADRLTQDSMSPQSTLDMARPSGEPALASGPALPTRGQTSHTSKPESPSRPNQDLGLTGPRPCPLAGQHELWDTQDPTHNCVRNWPPPPVI